MTDRADAFTRVALMLCLAVALLVRLPGFDSGLWFDEIWTLVEQVRAPLSKCLTEFESDNNHPLYSLCAWLTVHTLGESAWTLRLPALLFGLASLAALVRFARHCASPLVPELACFLLAISAHHISFSQDARAYTMLLFFSLMSSAFFLEALERPTRRNILGLGVCLALGTYAHLTAVFVALAQLLIFMGCLLRGKQRSWSPGLGILLGGGLSLVLHAPLLGDMLTFFTRKPEGPRIEAEWQNPLWTLGEVLESFGLPPSLGAVCVLVSLFVGGFGLVRVARRNHAAAWLCLLPALLGAVTLVALERNLWPRFFFFCAGFFVLVGLEGGLGVLVWIGSRTGSAARAVKVGLVLLLVAASWHGLRSLGLPKQDFEAAGEFALDRVGEEHARVLTVGLASFPYEAYYGGGFVPAETVEQLEEARDASSPAYVISTFPIFLESRSPGIAAWLEDFTSEVARFPGTKGDGDVVVYRIN